MRKQLSQKRLDSIEKKRNQIKNIKEEGNEVVELEELLKNKQLTFADIDKLNIFKGKKNDKDKNVLFDPSEYIDINIKTD